MRPLFKEKRNTENNRINIIMAIIFLFGGGLIYKLFDLQVGNYDFYSARADSQHKSFKVLEPERGKIFIQDDKNGGSLYPVATSKKFALLYAVPKDAKEIEKISESLFLIFKKEQIEKEIENLFKKEDKDRLDKKREVLEELTPEEKERKEKEIEADEGKIMNDPSFLELRKIKKEQEFEARKEAAINEYLEVFKKEDDPYEPIEKKVEEDTLKKLYESLGKDLGLDTNDLILKDERAFTKNETGKESEFKIEGLGFRMVNYRFYPEKNIGANMLGFVSLNGNEQTGNYGLEGFFNEELSGLAGSIKAEKGAGGNLIIVNDREYLAPKNGSDITLTINRAIQFTACKKLNEAVLRHGADGGSVIIMEPNTGAILAMCSNPDFDPNNYKEVSRLENYNNAVIFSQYEPGSIFKALTMAMALDQEKVTPETVYEDTGIVKIADYEIKNSDHKAHGKVDMNVVLQESLNTGVIFAMRQIGPKLFTQYLKNFGFGEKTGIELEGEAAGDIKNLVKDKFKHDLNAATASFGQGIAVTPLQMVSGFAAIANGGVLMKPYLVKEIIKPDGSRVATQPKQIRRVISARTSALLGGMLVNVVEKGHGKKAGVKGYYVGGKTGTAQVPRKDGRGYQAGVNIGSFAGFAPVENPRFAMLVRIDHPRDVAWAESSAAPLFGEIAEFLLNYWQVPTEREFEK